MMRSGALAARPTDKEGEKGRVEKTIVRRYRAGQAPAWVEQQQQQQEPAAAPVAGGVVDGATARAGALAEQVQRTAIAAPVVLKRADDPRLVRLAQRQVRGPEIVRRRQRTPGSDDGEGGGSGDDDDEGRGGAARRRGRSEASSGGEGAGAGEEAAGQQQQDEEEDEEAAQQRRDAIRERLRAQQQQQQEADLPAGAEEDEDEDESEYTSESESEDEGPGGRRLAKPVFVPKGGRETLAEREALEKEEADAAEAERLRAQQRKLESRQLVVSAIAADEAERRAMAEGGTRPAALEDVNTDDEDEAGGDDAFEAWKGREMSRIARDREERENAEKAARERERLRNMTEEERAAWERANPKEAKPEAQKAKWRFMQKYWHKGAFFQEAPDDARGTIGKDEIFDRDYSAPVGEDKFDKASLPAVMQVRNFGRTGRTKWKHLLAEDTSVARKEDEWYQPALQPNARTGAVSGGFARTVGAAPGGGGLKRPPGAEEFSKPKKFKT